MRDLEHCGCHVEDHSIALPEGKFINTPPSTFKWYKLGQPCISPKPSGAPMDKVPLLVVKEFEHQARQILCTAFTKVTSECNLTLEKCQDSIKATVKRIKHCILKGASPEKAVRHGYEKTCDYLDFLNKRILIQQRVLACQSKALAHILQREMYTMGNTVLIRPEAEMTHFQPYVRDSRHQKLWSSKPTPLFRSQLVKEGPPKKDTPKNTWGFGPYQTSPFVPPTAIRKEAPTRNVPKGVSPLQAVTNRFPRAGGNRVKGTRGHFQPHPSNPSSK